eukprot:TRINITY_DN3590_c0_g2_i1.p1 TRINITY_DN3590_c0_g2~~TRINITY_DN3590_c0_g2_i1.p1  ORF type:complete len:412 (+),score=87.46 TRINITY_DN3590_c0_g2_i1:35-1237(+)
MSAEQPAQTRSFYKVTAREEVKQISAEQAAKAEFRDDIFSLDSRYTPTKFLGKGTYGIVCQATDSVENREVAIKKVFNYVRNPIRALRTLREVQVMNRMDHPNVMPIYDMIDPITEQDSDDLYVVMPFLPVDLNQLIKHRTQDLPEETITVYILQLLLGLKYMHTAKIMHRDLKPANLLLGNEGELVIADFGFARTLDEQVEDDEEKSQELTKEVVTLWYRAPEVMLSEGRYDGFLVDVWSVGCIWAEMYNGKPLLPGRSDYDQLESTFRLLGTPEPELLERLRSGSHLFEKERFKKFTGNHLAEKVPRASEAVLNLMARMLEVDPELRITVDEALRDPIFAEYLDEDLCKEQMPKSTLVGQIQGTKQPVEKVKKDILKEMRRFRPEQVPESDDVSQGNL